jgi:hypothetical protein
MFVVSVKGELAGSSITWCVPFTDPPQLVCHRDEVIPVALVMLGSRVGCILS